MSNLRFDFNKKSKIEFTTQIKGVLSKLFNTEVASEALELNAGLMCDDGNIDGAIQVIHTDLLKLRPSRVYLTFFNSFDKLEFSHKVIFCLVYGRLK